MTGDRRIQTSPWQGRIAVLLLILAFIAVPAVALGGTDLTLNTTEPIAGVPDEIPPGLGAEENGTPEPTPTETVAEEVTPEAAEPLPESVGISASESAPLPAPRHIFFEVANNAGVKYDLDGTAYGGPNGTYYIKADGGGLNELRITNDVDTPLGQVTVSNDQSGVFWLTNNGGRGFYDDVILLVSVNGTIPDDFALHIKSSGYTWTPPSNATALPTDYTYVEGAVDETFTKEDFIYGPQTWKPGPGDLVVPSLPLYYGQDINDTTTASYLMFVDLNVGHMYPGSFTDATLTNNGGAKIEFTFTNLTSTAAFNGYGWCLAASSGEGISWTNRVTGTNSSSYLVTGVSSAPVADFTANVTSGDAPLAVAFTDASAGSPTSWAWDFENDGVVDSTEQNATFTYAAAGNYTVNLTVANDGGSDSEVRTDYITANAVAPIANFTASATSGTVPLFVRFTDLSANSPTSWSWDFGDGATSTEQNATHTYMAAGTYSVNLTVTNTAGSDSEVKQDLITVGETPSGKGLADTAWPKFGYDLRNTGQSPNLGPQTGTLQWTYQMAKTIYSQPAIGSDGTVYMECLDYNLTAINPDGTHKWTFTAGSAIYGTPAIGADGTLYMGCNDRNLYAVNPDGTLKWNCTLQNRITYSSPTIGPDGTIYIGSNGVNVGENLVAISDEGTHGTIKWTFDTVSDTAGIPAIGADGTIYAGSGDTNLYAVHPDGTLKWKYTTGGKMTDNSPSIGADGTIYIGSKDNKLYAINPDGTLKWTYTFGSYIKYAVAIGSDGTIYAGNHDKHLYAINPDGTLKWDFATEGNVDITPAIGSDGTIYIGSYDKKVYAVNPDGTLKWMNDLKSGVRSSPAIGPDGTLYLGGMNNKVYAFKDAVTLPVANFTANVTAGDAPLAVQFTDASTGSPTSWAWDFEDDGVVDSIEQNPVHIYAAAGTYTVNLTVTNDAGSDSAVKTGYIVVTEPYVPQPASVVVTPSTAELTVGTAQAFAATVYDTDGGVMDDVTVTWTNSNETVGTLNTAGLFTARAPGTTTVTAAYANVAGTAVVTVTRPQGDQTQNAPLDIPGCNVTTGNDGKPQVSINTTATNATVSGNTIRIVEGNFTLTIETEGAPTNESGTLNGTIANITLDTQPVVTELDSVGTVSASVSANLTGLPAGAGLTTTVSQNVSADAQSAFQLAASADGLTLGDVAYTMNIVKTNLDNGQDIAGATIRMTVSPAWVAAHGGADAIRIIRSAEDGTKEVLATTLVGTDVDGNMVFEAYSPNGLSIFGLAAATAASQPTQVSSSSGGSSGTSTSVGAASNLKSGESVTLTMGATAVSTITLTANTEVKDLMVTVAKGSLPRDAEPPAGTVYQYVQATLYKASEADLAAVQLRFAIPASWLAAQGCTAEQVTLFRYADGAWQAVPVEALGEENGNAVFSADPDGFGLFAVAITGQNSGVTGEATGEPTTIETPAGTSGTVAHAEEGQATPQATPFPVWTAILAFGALLFVRRT